MIILLNLLDANQECLQIFALAQMWRTFVTLWLPQSIPFDYLSPQA